MVATGVSIVNQIGQRRHNDAMLEQRSGQGRDWRGWMDLTGIDHEEVLLASSVDVTCSRE